MSELQWFWIFFLIFVISLALTGWMALYWRRSMKSHADQMTDIIREMREVIDAEQEGQEADRSDEAHRDSSGSRGGGEERRS